MEELEKFKAKIDPKATVEINLDAPLMFVDGASGFATAGDGLVRFNFHQDLLTVQPDNKDGNPITRRVCLRVVMTEKSAKQISRWLEDAAERKPSNAE